jgi:hypothetical protein
VEASYGKPHERNLAYFWFNSLSGSRLLCRQYKYDSEPDGAQSWEFKLQNGVWELTTIGFNE